MMDQIKVGTLTGILIIAGYNVNWWNRFKSAILLFIIKCSPLIGLKVAKDLILYKEWQLCIAAYST